MGWICRNCGTENDFGVFKCEVCNTKVDRDRYSIYHKEYLHEKHDIKVSTTILNTCKVFKVTRPCYFIILFLAMLYIIYCFISPYVGKHANGEFMNLAKYKASLLVAKTSNIESLLRESRNNSLNNLGSLSKYSMKIAAGNTASNLKEVIHNASGSMEGLRRSVNVSSRIKVLHSSVSGVMQSFAATVNISSSMITARINVVVNFFNKVIKG